MADAYKVASDFLVLRTTRKTVEDFLRIFDFAALRDRATLDFLWSGRPITIMRTGPPDGRVSIFDEELRPRLELEVVQDQGYARRGAVEYPAGGLRLRRWWDGDGQGQLHERAGEVMVGIAGENRPR